MNTVPPEQLTMDAFSDWVRRRFRVQTTEAAAVELELAEVSVPPAIPGGSSSRSGYESFSVVFVGPTEPLLPQHIYRLENESIGSFDLFLVPIGRGPGGIRYQAVFNRLIKPVQAG